MTEPTESGVIAEAIVHPPGPNPDTPITDGGRYCGRETCELNGVSAHTHLAYDETVRGSAPGVDDPTPRVPHAGPIDTAPRASTED